MPTMPPRLGRKQSEQRARDYEADRRRAKPWRKWYATAAWSSIRQMQLARAPWCERCLPDLVTPATVVNHIEPHRGDWQLFIGGPFESLCKACHDRDVQREERRARQGVGRSL